jgi:hypothetical protein
MTDWNLTPPGLEFAFEVRLKFERHDMIADTPNGFSRGGVYLDSGEFDGPNIRGIAIPGSGGDWAIFRPDGTLRLDARYMLKTDDGVVIMIHNQGYLWGRQPDTMEKFRKFGFEGGAPVPEDEYYFRTAPIFEAPKGKYDWLTRHVFIGVARRVQGGNAVRYFKVL